MKGVTELQADDFNETVNIYGVGNVTANFVNTDEYDKHKVWIFTLIRAFVSLGIVFYNVNQVYKLLNRGATLGAAHAISEQGRKEGN